MSDTTATYRQMLRVKDPSFDVNSLFDYELLLLLSSNELQVSVYDSKRTKVLITEHFAFADIQGYADLVDVLGQVWEEHHFLQANFWKSVKVAFRSSTFSLAPADGVSLDMADKVLKFTTSFNASRDRAFTYTASNGAVVFYGIHGTLTAFFDQKYPNAEVHYLHPSCGLLEKLLATENTNRLEAVIEKNAVLITAKRQGKLRYQNRLKFKNSNELAKLLHLALQSQKLPKDSTPVELAGNLKALPKLVEALKSQINQVQLASRPQQVGFSFHFDELPLHYHSDLYALRYC